MHFDACMLAGPVSFDDDEIDRCQPRHEVAQRGLGRIAQLVHNGKAPARSDQHFTGTRLPMPPRILAGYVDVEGMMGVLDRRNTQALPDEQRDHARQQCRLAGSAPAGEPDDPHA